MIQTTKSITSDNGKNYESLISLIENNQNQLSLIIVSCDDLTLRQEIISWYEREARLENIQAQRIVLGTEPSLKAGLVKLELPPEARVVVTVTGAEWLLRVKTRSSDAQSDLQKFFGYLQWTREGLRKFQYPIVLWITSTILREMSRKAPDFWSWRKAALRFTSEAANPVLPVQREYSSAPTNEAFASARVDRDDDDFIPPPAEILSEISQLAVRDPASANLATLYAKLAEIYTKRIARGEATDLKQEQQQAIDAYHQAIDRYRRLNKKSALANTLNKFGNFLCDQSRYRESIEFYQQSLAIQREISNSHGEASSLGNLGNIYRLLGNSQRAIDFYKQSLEIQREVGDRHDEAVSLSNLGNIYQSFSDYQEAIELYQQSLEIQREISNSYGEANSLGNLGNIYQSAGNYQRAIELYQQSLKIQREISDRRGEAASLDGLGEAYQSLKEYVGAITFHQQSLKIQREIGNLHGQAVSLYNQGNAYNSLGGCKEAINFYQQALEIQRKIGDLRGEANSLFHKARSHKNYKSQYSTARYELTQACEIYKELNSKKDIKDCNQEISALNQLITKQSKSAQIRGNLSNTRSPKIHWIVYFCVGLGICFLLFILYRK
jgi:tetratricopeptide (TPR) repeat protein